MKSVDCRFFLAIKGDGDQSADVLKMECSYTFDLWSVIRYHGISEKTRERLWDDGLHLTAAGYEVMGKAVAARLFELLQ